MRDGEQQFHWWSPAVITYTLLEFTLWFAVILGPLILLMGFALVQSGSQGAPSEEQSEGYRVGLVMVGVGAVSTLLGAAIVFRRSRLWIQRLIVAPGAWMKVWIVCLACLALGGLLEARRLRSRLNSLKRREVTIAVEDAETARPIPITLGFADPFDLDGPLDSWTRGNFPNEMTVGWVDWKPRVLEVSSPGYEGKSLTIDASPPERQVLPLTRLRALPEARPESPR